MILPWLLACSGDPVAGDDSGDTDAVVDTEAPDSWGLDTATETGLDDTGEPPPVERLSGSATVDDADARLLGLVAGAEAGWTLAAVGDVNGDGFADVLVGAHEDAREGELRGAAYLLLGPVSSGELGEPVVLGDEDRSFLGSALASAGDVDGDGRPDMLVAAPDAQLHANLDQSYGPGEVHLFTSPPEGTVRAGDLTWTGEQDGARLGMGLGGVGDVDGDGLDDLVLGAPVGGEDARGMAYLVLGSERELPLADAHRVWTGLDAGEQLGCDADGAGDLDGDGYADLWIGADADEAGPAGRVYGVLGGTELADSGAIDPHVLLTGEHENDTAGSTVLGADLDADGVGDVLVNAYGLNWAGAGGAAFVNYGPLSGVRDLVDSDAAVYGRIDETHGAEALGIAGDLDRDGVLDLVFGTHTYTDGFGASATGQVFVFYGPLSGEHEMDDAAWVATGATEGEQHGWATTGVGDVDGDGVDDLATSSWKHSEGASHGGAVYLWY